MFHSRSWLFPWEMHSQRTVERALRKFVGQCPVRARRPASCRFGVTHQTVDRVRQPIVGLTRLLAIPFANVLDHRTKAFHEESR